LGELDGIRHDERPRIVTSVEDTAPSLGGFVRALRDGRLVGQRCSTCRRVYVPGTGFCSIDLTATSATDEVEVSDRGYVSGYTIILPTEYYYGQQQPPPVVLASIMLDGASNPIVEQPVVGLPLDWVRNGLRVRARWRRPEDRIIDGLSNGRGSTLKGVIDGFEPDR
jgi:uncharacterized OB-fold protein